MSTIEYTYRCGACGKPMRTTHTREGDPTLSCSCDGDVTMLGDEGYPEPCPMGCGNLTDDPYGGPCDKCWSEVK